MQTETGPATRINPWLVPITILVVLLLLIWVIAGHTGAGMTPTDATQMAAEAERLSLQHVRDFENGIPLTEADKEQMRKAAVDFDALSDFRPRDIRPYLGAAKIYQALGNDDAAIQRLRKGLANMSTVSAPELTDTAIEAHYVLSVSQFNLHRYGEALQEVDQAIKMLPVDSPIYLAQRARTFIQLRKYEDATKDLMLALKVDPSYKPSLSLLKLIFMSASDALVKSATDKLNAKDYEGAARDCTNGLKVSPDFPPFLAIRGAAYVELGHKDLARADIRALLARDPHSKDAQTLEAKVAQTGG